MVKRKTKGRVFDIENENKWWAAICDHEKKIDELSRDDYKAEHFVHDLLNKSGAKVK